MDTDIKRLFFGVEVQSPWPSKLPVGRLLDEGHRHLTLAFLGNIPFSPLKQILHTFPEPEQKIGSTGYFDSCLLLPPRHPNVVAWHISWMDVISPLIAFQKKLIQWLLENQFSVDDREWIPHVTLCRKPFDPHVWKQTFVPQPFFTGSIHLYESVGHLSYLPIWNHFIKPPFEEISHTADMAFKIYGESLLQLYQNAVVALAFKFPPFFAYFKSMNPLESIDDIIIALNEIVSAVDSAIGSPLKAVSFHGEIVHLENNLLQWEMIVDV